MHEWLLWWRWTAGSCSDPWKKETNKGNSEITSSAWRHFETAAQTGNPDSMPLSRAEYHQGEGVTWTNLHIGPLASVCPSPLIPWMYMEARQRRTTAEERKTTRELRAFWTTELRFGELEDVPSYLEWKDICSLWAFSGDPRKVMP